MSASFPEASATAVEVRPEVVFLHELLQELTSGRLRIPRFQRPFVWRREQMTDLLDSVHRQYPIGSLLVWETESEIPTLDRLGPFAFPPTDNRRVGYLLDGHQRLTTLAGALISAQRDGDIDEADEDPGRWHIGYNFKTNSFEHIGGDHDAAETFPLTSLLDTIDFLTSVDDMRGALVASGESPERAVKSVSQVAKAFQSYRVPVIRIRRTGLSEAVEIFARLNSKGQAMSPDQMVSALMYRRDGEEEFDLATEITQLVERLANAGFQGIDRITVLRAILANLDENIYRTDWTRLNQRRLDDLLSRLRDAVPRTERSLLAACAFLSAQGASTRRLLPYSLQLVLLSAFFDAREVPSPAQLRALTQWFWTSSFSGWFAGVNSSRVGRMLDDLRGHFAAEVDAPVFRFFDLSVEALAYPENFDIRSARSRCLLLGMLDNMERLGFSDDAVKARQDLALQGGPGVARIFDDAPKHLAGDPANRMFRPVGYEYFYAYQWVESAARAEDWLRLEAHGIDRESARHLLGGNVSDFLAARRRTLVALEESFQQRLGVRTGTSTRTALAPLDAD